MRKWNGSSTVRSHAIAPPCAHCTQTQFQVLSPPQRKSVWQLPLPPAAACAQHRGKPAVWQAMEAAAVHAAQVANQLAGAVGAAEEVKGRVMQVLHVHMIMGASQACQRTMASSLMPLGQRTCIEHS